VYRGRAAFRTRYAPELNKRCRRELKLTNGSWRVDETYVCQSGSWRYLYRAVDSTAATIDSWFSAERDAAAARLAHWTLLDLRNILSAIFSKAAEWKLWQGENPSRRLKVGGPEEVREKSFQRPTN